MLFAVVIIVIVVIIVCFFCVIVVVLGLSGLFVLVSGSFVLVSGLFISITLTVVLIVIIFVVIVVIIVSVFEVLAVLYSLLSFVSFLAVLLASLLRGYLELCLNSCELFVKFLLKLISLSLLFSELSLESCDLFCGELIVIIVVIVIFFASVLELILDIVYLFAKLEEFFVLFLESVDLCLVITLAINCYLFTGLEKLKKVFYGEVKKLVVSKLGICGENSCNDLCVTGSYVPLLSGCEVGVKNFLGNLTGDTLLFEELNELVVDLLFNLFGCFCAFAVYVNVNSVFSSLRIHKSKVNCCLGECLCCILDRLTLKLNGRENYFAVLVYCVSGNDRAVLVGNHFDFGVDSQTDVGEFTNVCTLICYKGSAGSKCRTSKCRYQCNA